MTIASVSSPTPDESVPRGATPLRVLLIDSADDSSLVLNALRECDYEPSYERVETRPAMLAALDRQRWDIVISEYAVPDLPAAAALAILKERQLETPFIVASGTLGEEAAVA